MEHIFIEVPLRRRQAILRSLALEQFTILVGAPFLLDGRALEVTTSIGIAFQGPDDASLDAPGLLARADAALYDAKATGRNTFRFAA